MQPAAGVGVVFEIPVKPGAGVPVADEVRQIHRAGAGDIGPVQLVVGFAGSAGRAVGGVAGGLAEARGRLAEGEVAALVGRPGEVAAQIIHDDAVVGVADDGKDAVSGGATVGGEGNGLRVFQALRRGPLRLQRKNQGGVAAGRRQRVLEQAHEYELHEVVLVADHIKDGLAAAHREAVAGCAGAVHFLRRPGEGRRVVNAEGSADAGQVVGAQLRGHGAQGVAGEAGAAGVNPAGQPSAEFAGGGDGAHSVEGGAAGGGVLAQQPDGVQGEADIGDALAEQVAHHRGGARHAAGDGRDGSRVKVGDGLKPAGKVHAEQQPVEGRNHLGFAVQNRVGIPHFGRRCAGGKGRGGVVKYLGQAAVGYESGGGHDVAVGGQELGVGAPHRVVAAQSVGDDDDGKPAVGGFGVQPGVLGGGQVAAVDVGDYGGLFVGAGRRQQVVAGGIGELRVDAVTAAGGGQHRLVLEKEVQEVGAPLAAVGRVRGTDAVQPAGGGIRPGGIPELENHGARLAGGFNAAQGFPVAVAGVGGVPGVETLPVVHGKGGNRAHGVVAIGGLRREGVQRVGVVQPGRIGHIGRFRLGRRRGGCRGGRRRVCGRVCGRSGGRRRRFSKRGGGRRAGRRCGAGDGNDGENEQQGKGQQGGGLGQLRFLLPNKGLAPSSYTIGCGYIRRPAGKTKTAARGNDGS